MPWGFGKHKVWSTPDPTVWNAAFWSQHPIFLSSLMCVSVCMRAYVCRGVEKTGAVSIAVGLNGRFHAHLSSNGFTRTKKKIYNSYLAQVATRAIAGCSATRIPSGLSLSLSLLLTPQEGGRAKWSAPIRATRRRYDRVRAPCTAYLPYLTTYKLRSRRSGEKGLESRPPVGPPLGTSERAKVERNRQVS